MVEQIKSFILILLILSSIFLTWQIWTYQPQYDYISSTTEYVTHEGLAERKELDELIRPEAIIYHYGEDRHRVAYPDMYQYRSVQIKMPEWYFYNFTVRPKEEYQLWQERINEYKGIELSFPTGVPFHVLTNIFQTQTETTPSFAVNRIWIFQDESVEEMNAMFISEKEQRMLLSNTSISSKDVETFLKLAESRPLSERYVFQHPKENEIYAAHYLATNPIDMTEYRYFFQRIMVDTMIQYLFVDPTLVRQIPERNGGIFYTDGSRGLQLNRENTNMHYIHPSTEQFQPDMDQSERYIQRSIQFVNQHQGWDQTYLLYEIDESEQDENIVVLFRKFLGNYPIFSAQSEEEVNVIQLELHYDRVVGYHRPLIEYDRVMDKVERTLPSGVEVIESLKATNFPVEEIDQVSLAYRSEIQEYYLGYVPFWVIQMENGERLFLQRLPELPEVEEEDEEHDMEERVEEEADELE